MSEEHDDRPHVDGLEMSVRDAISPSPAEPTPEHLRQLRARVEAARSHLPAGTPLPSVGPRHRPRRAVLGLAAAALVLIGAVAGASLTAVLDQGDQDLSSRGTAEFDAVLTGSDVQVSIDGAAAPEGRVVTLRSESLPVLPVGEYYELWFLPADQAPDGRWISAGTFHPDDAGRTQVVLHAAVDPRLAGRVEVTREPDDGDPAPSAEVVAQGEVRLFAAG